MQDKASNNSETAKLIELLRLQHNALAALVEHCRFEVWDVFNAETPVEKSEHFQQLIFNAIDAVDRIKRDETGKRIKGYFDDAAN